MQTKRQNKNSAGREGEVWGKEGGGKGLFPHVQFGQKQMNQFQPLLHLQNSIFALPLEQKLTKSSLSPIVLNQIIPAKRKGNGKKGQQGHSGG